MSCVGADVFLADVFLADVCLDNVASIVPAALALGVHAGADDHRFLCRRGHRRQHCAGGDQHEAQIVLQRLQQFQFTPARADLDFSLQRGADAAGDARFLQLLLHFGAHAADFSPAREQFRCIVPDRKLVPCVGEHAHILFLPGAAGHGPDFFRGERKDGRHQAHQALQDLVQRVLRGAPRL